MGYLSCNGESAIAICNPCYNDLKNKAKTITNPHRLKKIRQFSYAELFAATNGFSADNFLGKGSHGSVYKAVFDDGSLVAAVKKTKFSSTSTNCTHFSLSNAENEIEILSTVRYHRHVNLLGFCNDSKEGKLIVVEYMPNGSLFDLLHVSSTPPGWTRRVRLALQVAKAVQALHSSNPPVIHRDIKSSNVLIDESFDARLGDFGLALRGHVEDVRVKCTPPAGTLGYLDPSYLAPGDLSAKSDVFSFGILLLEIISGRNAIDVNYSPPSVVDWAVPMIKRGEFAGMCDRRMKKPADLTAIRLMAVLAARCVRSTAEKRPAMAEVIEWLKNVKKRVRLPPLWNNMRRRVDNSQPSNRREAVGASEEVVKTSKMGSRRNGKVSDVSSTEYESEAVSWVGDRVVRSKSVGSAKDLKAGPGTINLGPNHVPLGSRKPGVAVKMAVMRLSKSRSMGVLQSPKLLPSKSKLVHI